ncbi:MAG TPA: GTP-binding protein [Aestuariivirgaceae bacterium]|nr:GTP-binding protein [Aestuariivirgaceae bacterium]
MRLMVLGGYLGSGKTTWLRHQLHHGQLENVLIIINEAAETPIDDALLSRSASAPLILAGGCACCTGKADLVALLRRISDEQSGRSAGEARVGQIVLETSGLADPGPIVDAIRSDPVIAHHILVSEIVVMVDALHALSQLASEPLGRRQIEIADRLIIAKVDEANVTALTRLLATLRTINPGAVLTGSVKGSATALPEFDGVPPEHLPALPDDAERPPVFPVQLKIDQTIDWIAFTTWLSALLHARGDDVLRVKGVVRTPAGRLLVQSVRRIVQRPEILPDPIDGSERDDDVIVVIGRGYEADDLRRSLRRFAGE